MKRIIWFVVPLVILTLAHNGIPAATGKETAEDHVKAFADCAKACTDCSNSCAVCYHHCVELVSAGEKAHAKTLVLCDDCSEICSTAGKLTSRHSPFTAAICETCAKSCDECRAACEKYPDDKHMRGCAQACKECAASCRAMIEHLEKP